MCSTIFVQCGLEVVIECIPLRKLSNFEQAILPLLPERMATRRDKLIGAWKLWKNAQKIEAAIIELQDDIRKVIQMHVVSASSLFYFVQSVRPVLHILDQKWHAYRAEARTDS